MNGKLADAAFTVVLVAAGVILAGALMNALYDSVELIEYASDGFDK